MGVCLSILEKALAFTTTHLEAMVESLGYHLEWMSWQLLWLEFIYPVSIEAHNTPQVSKSSIQPICLMQKVTL